MLKALVVDGVKAASVCEASFELPSAVLLFEPLAVPVCVVSTRGSAFVVVSGLELGKDSPAPDAFPVAFELAVAAWLLFPLLLSDEAAGSEELAPLLLAGSAVKAAPLELRQPWLLAALSADRKAHHTNQCTTPMRDQYRRPVLEWQSMEHMQHVEFDAYSFAYDM
ncbi:hypothetical protein KC323_g75 [Hortaea werneckii]|nr:hypothetical protein KC323_g75 [Hortaea werneckii]